MLGGVLLIAYFGAGPLSFDRKTQNSMQWRGENTYEKEILTYDRNTCRHVYNPIWTDINNGPLQPIPIDTPLADLKVVRDNLVRLKNQNKVLKQSIAEHDNELTLYYENRQNDLMKNLEEWYGACKKYQINLLDPAFRYVSQAPYFRDRIYWFLQDSYESNLMFKQFKKRYSETTRHITDGIVTLIATRAKPNKTITYNLDDFFTSIADYTEATVKAQYRDLRVDSILD
jgi:hypothetical protein